MARKLKLIRTCDFYGSLRALTLFIDEEKAGSIRAGETLVLEIPDGAQILRGRMDWAYTERQVVSDLGDGAVVEICGRFSVNPLRWLGIPTIPFRFAVLDGGTAQN